MPFEPALSWSDFGVFASKLTINVDVVDGCLDLRSRSQIEAFYCQLSLFS